MQFYEGSLQLAEENYYEIVLQKTTLKNSDFENIEKKIRLTIPQEFKNFFFTAYSYDRHFQLPGLSLATAWYENNFVELNSLIFEQGCSKRMLKQKLVPVGFYQDNFYVCLDLRNTTTNNDVPITYFDLDNAGWKQEPVLVENVYTSFTHFIEHYTNCIVTGVY
ncbi:MAG: SMI1/KNR4 family protein [Agriterribacter sp.]